MRATDVRGHFLLEGGDFRAEDEVLRFHHAGDGLHHVVADRGELGAQVEERKRLHGRFGFDDRLRGAHGVSPSRCVLFDENACCRVVCSRPSRLYSTAMHERAKREPGPPRARCNDAFPATNERNGKRPVNVKFRKKTRSVDQCVVNRLHSSATTAGAVCGAVRHPARIPGEADASPVRR